MPPPSPSSSLNLLIIGSTGGTGRELVRQSLEQGHRVTAFARKPEKVRITHERLRVLQGDVMDYPSVDRAVVGQDAVLCALGHKRWIIKTSILSEGTRNIIRAMETHRVRRLVCETSLGIGDSRGRLGIQYSLFLIPFLLFFYFRDKKFQEKRIRKSSLEWVVVRPGVLTNGKQRGKYRHGPDVGSYLWTVRISRADVAEFMLKQVTDNTYLRKAVGVAN
jgi:putative NADH-flavin reductase